MTNASFLNKLANVIKVAGFIDASISTYKTGEANDFVL